VTWFFSKDTKPEGQPKRYVVALEITLNESQGSPVEWDWAASLELDSNESVVIIGVVEVPIPSDEGVTVYSTPPPS
jgi:hypothetical protein